MSDLFNDDFGTNGDDFLSSIFDESGQGQNQDPSFTAPPSQSQPFSDINPPALSPQMFMGNHHDAESHFMGQGQSQGHGQGHSRPQSTQSNQSTQSQAQSQAQLDANKQEQLLKMRQQIMQQQVHQKQQSRSNISSPQPGSRYGSGGGPVNGQGNGQGQGNGPGSVPGSVPGSGPGSGPYGSPAYMSPNDMTQRPPQRQQRSQQLQQSPMQQSMHQSPVQQSPLQSLPPSLPQSQVQHQQQAQPQTQQAPIKPTSQQIAQLQLEVFTRSYQDFRRSRGGSTETNLVINGKRINLFFFYILTQKLGGQQALIKSIQQPSSNQPSPWLILGQKLGLIDNIQDQSARHQVEKEIAKFYIQYIHPYETYSVSIEGQKEMQQRKLLIQKQFLLNLQAQGQAQAQPQAQGQSQMSSQAQGQPQAPNQIQKQNIQQHISQHNSPMGNSPMQQHISPQLRNSVDPLNQGGFNSPNLSQAPTPQQPLVKKSSHASIQSMGSPVVGQSPYTQTKGSRSGSVLNRPRSNSPQIVNENQGEPTIVKNLLANRKNLESYGGVDIKTVSSVGEEIDISKPVYLFAPELGTVDIQSLTMSLKNNTIANNGEIMSALNTLLVTSSEQNTVIDLHYCIELLEALADTGLKVLDKIVYNVKWDKESAVEKVDYDNLRTNNVIDDIFNKYVQPGMVDEELMFNVDSLTGNIVDDDSDNDMDDIFSPPVEIDTQRDVEDIVKDEEDDEEEDDDAMDGIDDDDEEEIEKFSFQDYHQILVDFKAENKYHFSTLQTKSATNKDLLLVDELITITMILRNLSFHPNNKTKMSSNDIFRDFLFAVIKMIGIYPEKFLFNRKRLCLTKDCLFLLYNISQEVELRSLEEGFLSLALISSFGPDLYRCESIPIANVDKYSYLPYGIDALTKLLVREPHNRTFMKAILTGDLNVNSNKTSIKIEPSDKRITRKLICKYLKTDDITNGELLTRTFNLFLCIVPFNTNSFEFAKAINLRISTFTQTFFGAKILIDLISDAESNFKHLSPTWLINNRSEILINLLKISISLNPESVKNKLLALVLLKCLIMINTLLNNTVLLLETGTTQQMKDKIAQLISIRSLYPDREITLETLLNPVSDKNLSNEIIRFWGLLKQIESYV